MGRYTGPVCRLCRRAGEKLFLKGEKCFSPKCPVERRRTPPGVHPVTRRRQSDYALQLREKQKVRYLYGLMEKQFRRYVERAQANPKATGTVLLQLLERRLDNVVYRLGWADSRAMGRQLVRHGHITVNGRKVNVPSYEVKPGDVVGWRASSKNSELFKQVQADAPKRNVPGWLTFDKEKMEGRVLRVPEAQEMEATVDTRLVVEFYTR